MTIKLSSVLVDVKAEREGDWVAYAPWPGVRFKVRSFEYPEYSIARNAVIKKLSKKYDDDPIPPDVMNEKLGAVIADHILLDWEGFDEAYSQEAASDYLTKPKGRQVFSAVSWCANKVGIAELEYVKEAEKN